MKFIKHFEGIKSGHDMFLSRTAVDPIDASDNQKKTFDIIRRKLESDCQPYLKSHKNKFLLRGIIDNKLYGKPLVRKTVRTDRNPMNTHHMIQDLIDDIFEEKFSVRPRSSGLFTHTHYNKASYYGSVWMVFPIGEYDAFWHSELKDLFSDMPTNKYEYFFRRRQKEQLFQLFGKPHGLTQPEMDEWIEEYTKVALGEYKKFMEGVIDGYNQGDIGRVDKQEIMIMCDEYYIVNVEYYKFIHEWLNTN